MDPKDSANRSPPKHAQFKKGQSGNPRGRPKGSRNLAGLLKEALEARSEAGDGQMTKLEAAVKQIADNAAAGDPKMLQMLLAELRRLEPPKPAIDPYIAMEMEMHQKLLDYIAWIRRLAATPGGLEGLVETFRQIAEEPDPPAPYGTTWPSPATHPLYEEAEDGE